MLRYRIRRSHWLTSGLMFLWVPDPARPGQLIDLVAGRRTRTPGTHQTPIWRPAGSVAGLDLPCLEFNRATPHGIEYPNSAARGEDPMDGWLALSSYSASAIVARATNLTAGQWQGIAVKNRDIIGAGTMGHFVQPSNAVQVHSNNTAVTESQWYCGVGVYHDGTNRRTTASGEAVATTAHSLSGSGTGAFRFGWAVVGENFSGQIALHAGWFQRNFTNSALQQIAGHTLDKSLSSITDLVEAIRGPVHAPSLSLASAASLGAGIGAAEVVVTVSHTGHGYSTGQKVLITGANEGPYNGIKTITVVDPDTYTYTAIGNPSTPATGTLKSHRVVLDGETDVGGTLESADFNYTADLAVTGAVRKASGGTLYKPAPLSGTITSAGLDLTAFLTQD